MISYRSTDCSSCPSFHSPPALRDKEPRQANSRTTTLTQANPLGKVGNPSRGCEKGSRAQRGRGRPWEQGRPPEMSRKALQFLAKVAAKVKPFTVTMALLVGPTDLFVGFFFSQNPFSRPPLRVPTPPTAFHNVGAAGVDLANVDPPCGFLPPLRD